VIEGNQLCVCLQLQPGFGHGLMAPYGSNSSTGESKVASNQHAVLAAFSLSSFLSFHVSRVGVCLKYSSYAGFFGPLVDKETWDLAFLVIRSSCGPHSCLPSDLALSLLVKQHRLAKLVVGPGRGLLEIQDDERNTRQKTMWMSI